MSRFVAAALFSSPWYTTRDEFGLVTTRRGTRLHPELQVCVTSPACLICGMGRDAPLTALLQRYARDDLEEGLNLCEVIKRVNPTMLLGLTGRPG